MQQLKGQNKMPRNTLLIQNSIESVVVIDYYRISSILKIDSINCSPVLVKDIPIGFVDDYKIGWVRFGEEHFGLLVEDMDLANFNIVIAKYPLDVPVLELENNVGPQISRRGKQKFKSKILKSLNSRSHY